MSDQESTQPVPPANGGGNKLWDRNPLIFGIAAGVVAALVIGVTGIALGATLTKNDQASRGPGTSNFGPQGREGSDPSCPIGPDGGSQGQWPGGDLPGGGMPDGGMPGGGMGMPDSQGTAPSSCLVIPKSSGQGMTPGGMMNRTSAESVLHGEFVVKDSDGATVTRTTQRGEVTSVSTTSISVKSTDGFRATYRITDDSDVRVGLKSGSAAVNALKKGDDVQIAGRHSGGHLTALSVVSVSTAVTKG